MLVQPDFGLLFWQTVTFLIVLFILGKFAWKPILGALKEREADIEEALSAAENAKEELKRLHAANEKLLQDARLERDKILKEASAVANSIITEAKDKATAESNRIVEGAKIAINNEKLAAMTEVKNQAATIAIDIAEKLLRKELSDSTAQKELVSEYLKEAKFN
ncbi:F0F1 ATP synthase subunit B [Sporocytophaga myxococcoides]|uniref:ATP synthase subunit b n=1 Tax=Sporocytophaga myxococcoides TaxID=153721 RepID=A0A098L9U6_9BACT|nr:F0F1 ATP synthase subunit B [Sporocytophaga myxococcoides]GAL83720.1 F0F1 ATP synthase subunit B [Sporocytophaga myxococcoides]